MTSSNKLTHWCVVVGVVYVLLVAIDVMGSGFSQASGGRSGAQELFAFAKNPFVGVLLGIMATALVQSSSTVTSIIVGMVAGGLPVSVAIPMVMGANLGTTITNTLVSFGHVGVSHELQESVRGGGRARLVQSLEHHHLLAPGGRVRIAR